MVSTPIFYVNSAPHIGHLYSALLADAHYRFRCVVVVVVYHVTIVPIGNRVLKKFRSMVIGCVLPAA